MAAATRRSRIVEVDIPFLFKLEYANILENKSHYVMLLSAVQRKYLPVPGAYATKVAPYENFSPLPFLFDWQGQRPILLRYRVKRPLRLADFYDLPATRDWKRSLNADGEIPRGSSLAPQVKITLYEPKTVLDPEPSAMRYVCTPDGVLHIMEPGSGEVRAAFRRDLDPYLASLTRSYLLNMGPARKEIAAVLASRPDTGYYNSLLGVLISRYILK